ncbi:hypothetical protein C9374_008287 [Naegleria lovaniensis]|uniref:Uncharacterized protein n=1 Tax=Naegleria lovaniensis TaxID=51637 RepID=A0AA88GHH6_NAELO|nr:uncharacterized protein C9374_008287 [Naegleria lovaniensis]KAG2378648.1 hypothetical protein C9374_008287 [Naegleria lovaniensis]
MKSFFRKRSKNAMQSSQTDQSQHSKEVDPQDPQSSSSSSHHHHEHHNISITPANPQSSSSEAAENHTPTLSLNLASIPNSASNAVSISPSSSSSSAAVSPSTTNVETSASSSGGVQKGVPTLSIPNNNRSSQKTITSPRNVFLTPKNASVSSSSTSPRQSPTPRVGNNSQLVQQQQPNHVMVFNKKPQPPHTVRLQLEDLLAISYKQRTRKETLHVQKYIFIIDFSFMDSPDVYNNVKKAYMSYIHTKNQSNWNMGSEGSGANDSKFETEGNIVTLTIMGINKNSIQPLWTSDNEKLFELHYMQGMIRPENFKTLNPQYFLSPKNVIDCCEYLDNNSNFIMNSNPYEDYQDIVNLDQLAQFILKSLPVCDINIMTCYLEKANTRVSISQLIMYELERLLQNSTNSLHIDIVKMSTNSDVGVLSVPPPYYNGSTFTGMNYGDRVIFDNLEQFLRKIRQRKNVDFSFVIGIGKSDVVNTNKEFEYQVAKCFSLCTADPKLRTYSISLFDEMAHANPLTDYIYQV